jgi:hypothetical protein
VLVADFLYVLDSRDTGNDGTKDKRRDDHRDQLNKAVTLISESDATVPMVGLSPGAVS